MAISMRTAITPIANMSALLHKVLNSFIGVLSSCFMRISWIPIGNKKAPLSNDF